MPVRIRKLENCLLLVHVYYLLKFIMTGVIIYYNGGYIIMIIVSRRIHAGRLWRIAHNHPVYLSTRECLVCISCERNTTLRCLEKKVEHTENLSDSICYSTNRTTSSTTQWLRIRELTLARGYYQRKLDNAL